MPELPEVETVRRGLEPILVPAIAVQTDPPGGELDAVARVLFNIDDPVLHFNYRSEHNQDWGRDNWMNDLGYRTVYPAEGEAGLVVDLDPS